VGLQQSRFVTTAATAAGGSDQTVQNCDAVGSGSRWACGWPWARQVMERRWRREGSLMRLGYDL
jgi:hypothetical protein